ncbi:glycerol-3-phosphate cytidylyltransferase [Photobacterium rosenbergii]|uniref:Glycerol-3-phosphate cytidylyltransferase n=1 Tax=Photobacterium rosenbergii TaxID=294936 RepID=A0A2T3NBK2_9GAMM|nr:glycerol-3-phosphate cytidylyltransferase [Photobacterium rosenbergii]PSW11219.1 glycerol-3-phosphate cytidylyltransferase [Photobacterium rosenbergii]
MIIITYGTFDLFHVGHVRLLKRLKSCCDELYVGVSTDEFNLSKGKKSFFSYDERSEIVSSCKYVDHVFPENCWEQKVSDIQKYNADIFAIGDDWKGKFDFLNDHCKVMYIERTKDISTTDIKSSLSSINDKKLDEIEGSLHSIIEIVRSISVK